MRPLVFSLQVSDESYMKKPENLALPINTAYQPAESPKEGMSAGGPSGSSDLD